MPGAGVDEDAGLVAVGAGEGALAVAEKLVFQAGRAGWRRS